MAPERFFSDSMADLTRRFFSHLSAKVLPITDPPKCEIPSAVTVGPKCEAHPSAFRAGSSQLLIGLVSYLWAVSGPLRVTISGSCLTPSLGRDLRVRSAYVTHRAGVRAHLLVAS